MQNQAVLPELLEVDIAVKNRFWNPVLYCTVLYCTVQGLFQLTHWFYLPAALFIPPAQFLVHSQFVFLFQFWIHSELVGDLGPLGLVFNTSTFHQVYSENS